VSARGLFVLVVCAAVGGAGCGDDPESRPARTPGIEIVRELVVSPAEVRKERATPSGTVLEWWRALQTGNRARATRVYRSPADAREIAAEIQTLSEVLGRSRPRLVSERVNGPIAHVRISIVTAVLDGGSIARISETPASLRLVRTAPGWRLSDNALLEQWARLERLADAG
jgi:hypothetical protein